MEPLILSGPTRVYVKVARKRFDRDVKRAGGDEKAVDVALMNDVIRFATGDPAKALHMGTSKSERRVMILFEYDNDEHDPGVRVIGFRIKKHIKPLCTPASAPEYIHSCFVARWLHSIDNYGCKFPIRTVHLPPGVPNPWAPRPTKLTDGQGGESSGQGERKEEEGVKREEVGEKKDEEGGESRGHGSEDKSTRTGVTTTNDEDAD